MPSYLNQPGQKVKALQPGVPEYLYGSWNSDVETTKMLVSQVALTADVATLTVAVVRGNLPAVGSLVSVSGTQTGGGEFNVTRAPLTAVAINASTGIGTISYALTAANVATTPDAGVALVDTPEIPDVLANGSSVPAAPQPETVAAQRTMAALVLFPTVPTDATVTLQFALRDIDSEYQKLGTVATVAASAVTPGTLQYPAPAAGFYRFNVSGLTGAGTIVAKLLT